MNKKFIYIVIATLILIGGILGYNFYQKIFGKAITEKTVLFVYPTDNLLDLENKIANFSKHPKTFLLVAAKKKFSKPKTGRYILKKGMSNGEQKKTCGRLRLVNMAWGYQSI